MTVTKIRPASITPEQETLNFTAAHHTELVSRLCLVTPELAALWLQHQPQNRKLNQSHVRVLTSEILRGAWRTTGAGLQFNQRGQLVDGQHRLRAIIRAKQPVVMFITCGNSDHAVFDDGIGRTLQQQMTIATGAGGWQARGAQIVSTIYNIFGAGRIPKTAEFFDAACETIGAGHVQAVTEASGSRWAAPIRSAFAYARAMHPAGIDLLMKHLHAGDPIVTEEEQRASFGTTTSDRNVTVETLYRFVAQPLAQGGRSHERRDAFVKTLAAVVAFVDGRALHKLMVAETAFERVIREREARGLQGRLRLLTESSDVSEE